MLVTLFAPALFGLLLLTAVHRALTYWQKDRTWQMLFGSIIFFMLCLLYLASSLMWPTVPRDIVRWLLVVALLLDNVFGWRDMIAFMRKKAKGQKV